MNINIDMKSELTKAISGIEDLFSVELKQTEVSDMFLETYAFLIPKFEHKNVGLEIKSIFDAWYKNGYLTLKLTMHNGAVGMSLFIRGVSFHHGQRLRKKDVHGENGESLSKGLRAFSRGLIREWKKEAEKRNDAMSRAWVVETFKAAIDAHPAERKRIDEFGESVTAHMSSTHISKMAIDIKKGKEPDVVNLDLSISLKNIDSDKLKAIMVLLQQI